VAATARLLETLFEKLIAGDQDAVMTLAKEITPMEAEAEGLGLVSTSVLSLWLALADLSSGFGGDSPVNEI